MVRGVDTAGVLTLADGRQVVLAGIALDAAAISALAALATGRMVVLHPLPRPRDRWNRLVAHVALAAPGAGGKSLAATLLAHGLGHAAAMGHGACMTQLLADEAVARTAHLGVWRKPGYVLAATDVAALSRHLGEHVVAAGRVISVRVLRTRAYVNFAHRRGGGLSVMVRKRAWSRNGIGAAEDSRLAGRRLRVRGHLEWRGGPLIELTDEEPLERLDR
jgi:hypothetical protein